MCVNVLHTNTLKNILHASKTHLLDVPFKSIRELHRIKFHLLFQFFSSLEKPKERKCGDRWMIRGPRCYIPPIELDVVEQGDGQLVR